MCIFVSVFVCLSLSLRTDPEEDGGPETHKALALSVVRMSFSPSLSPLSLALRLCLSLSVCLSVCLCRFFEARRVVIVTAIERLLAYIWIKCCSVIHEG